MFLFVQIQDDKKALGLVLLPYSIPNYSKKNDLQRLSKYEIQKCFITLHEVNIRHKIFFLKLIFNLYKFFSILEHNFF